MKNSYKTICFLLLCLILLIGLNIAFGARLRSSSWYAFKKLPKDSIDIIFLGNSHVYNTFQARVVEDVLDKNTFTLGIPNDSIQYMLFELKEILRTQSPEIIVIDSYSLEIEPALTQSYSFSFIDVSNWNLDKLKFIINSFSNGNSYQIFPLARYHATFWKESFRFFKEFNEFIIHENSSETLQQIQTNQGFSFVETIISNWETRYQEEIVGVEKHLDNHNLQTFDKFVQICKENNIKIIFTTTEVFSLPPISQGSIISVDAMQIADTYQIPYINFAKEYPLYEIHFTNPSHYSSFGSLNTTLNTIKMISKFYNIPINIDIFKSYQEVAIENIEIIVSSGKININITPVLSSELIQYNLRCQQKNTKNIIQDNSKNPVVQCNKLVTGTYQVDISLYHPTLDYIIKGILEIDVP